MQRKDNEREQMYVCEKKGKRNGERKTEIEKDKKKQRVRGIKE